MIRLLTCIICVLWGASVSAQTIPIRSGEHANFSRLVLTIPPGSGWTLRQTPTEANIRVNGSNPQFVTSRIFDRIPRNRITSVNGSGNTLTLNIGCECFVNAFLYRSDLLVIDVKEGTLERPQGPSEPAQPSVPEIVKKTADLDPPGNGGRSITLPLISEAASEIDLSSVQGEIIRGVAMALSQGILTPAQRQALKVEEEPESVSENSEMEEPAQEPFPQPVPVRTTQATDHFMLNNGTQSEAQTFDGLECFAPSFFAAFVDLDETDFGERVSTLRRNLYGEFDAIDADIAEALIDLYLSQGFGAEARVILGEADLDDRWGIKRSVSYIVEDGFDPSEISPLRSQISCDGPSALWGVMAHRELPTSPPVNVAAVMREFQALPRSVRNHLGPKLSLRLTESGYQGAGAAISRALIRITKDTPAALALAEARLLRNSGEIEQADILLTSLSESQTPAAIDALVELMDLRIKTGREISRDEAQLVAARAFEMQDSEREEDLTAIAVQSLSRAGLQFEAVELFHKLNSRSDLALWLSESLSKTTPAPEFLEFAFREDGAMPPPIDHPAFLQRLVELGFEDRAAELARRNRVPLPNITGTSSGTAQVQGFDLDQNLRSPDPGNFQSPDERLSFAKDLLESTQKNAANLDQFLSNVPAPTGLN